jgi:hypothetical protein
LVAGLLEELSSNFSWISLPRLLRTLEVSAQVIMAQLDLVAEMLSLVMKIPKFIELLRSFVSKEVISLMEMDQEYVILSNYI